MEHFMQWLLILRAGLLPRPSAADAERGDVPGWVMITLMTAALVAAIWAIAGTQLTALLENALSSVAGIH